VQTKRKDWQSRGRIDGQRADKGSCDFARHGQNERKQKEGPKNGERKEKRCNNLPRFPVLQGAAQEKGEGRKEEGRETLRGKKIRE